MVIFSEYRMGQYRDTDHREDALHFILQKHYFGTFNYDKTKPNELNETEFVKFWSDFYALFDKIDKNGDGEIAVIECVTLLDEKSEKFGLGKSGWSFSNPLSEIRVVGKGSWKKQEVGKF